MKLLPILILMLCAATVSAVDVDTTNTVELSNTESYGGTDYIIPHQHYWDSWFSVHNDGHISYMIYMYDYAGNHPNNYTYTNSNIGILHPGETISLNSNASYRFYAEYNDIQDIGDVEVIEKKFNQYWLIILVGLIFIIALFVVWRVIKK